MIKKIKGTSKLKNEYRDIKTITEKKEIIFFKQHKLLKKQQKSKQQTKKHF